jgi:hypothetical protein
MLRDDPQGFHDFDTPSIVIGASCFANLTCQKGFLSRLCHALHSRAGAMVGH